MSIGSQLDLAGDMAWMHELRGPDGRWIKGAALHKLALHLPARKLKPGDAILIERGSNAKPFEVIRAAKGAIRVRDRDSGAEYNIDRGPEHQFSVVGAGGLGAVADIRDIRREAAIANLSDEERVRAELQHQKPPGEPTSARSELTGPVDKELEAARAQLEADIASGVRSESKPHAKRGLIDRGRLFGNTADTSVVTFNNGHKWIRKRSLPPREQQAEHLGSMVGAALGAGSPLAFQRPEIGHKESDHTPGWTHDPAYDPVWMKFVPGAQPAVAWMGGADEQGDPISDEADVYGMYVSPKGRRIGLLDALTLNEDRHPGNWMVKKTASGEEPVPIDMGRAYRYKQANQVMRRDGRIQVGFFTDPLFDDGIDGIGAITADEWDEMRNRLSSLEGAFTAEGKKDDFDSMMDTFELLREDSEAWKSSGGY